MSEKPILDIKDLKLYFKFAEDQHHSSNYFYASASQSVQVNPVDFYRKSLEESSRIQLELDDFEFSKKKLLKETQNYLKLMKVIDGVNLTIPEGKNIGIIGEKGCGKTSLLLSLLNFPRSELKYISGKILYKSSEGVVDLLTLPEKEMRKLRGHFFGFIPQLTKESIDPWLKLGFQTGEILKEHLSENQEIIKEKVIEYLGKGAFPDPGISLKKYVHDLSSADAQKIIIAMGLIANPMILLADEIFNNVDVITQNNITQLLKDLHDQLPFQFIFTTHNIAAAINLTDFIAIMYAGEIVEVTTAKNFMDEPLHPYSQGLLHALPWYALRKGVELEVIEGEPPSPFVWPTGCRFSPRCPKAMARCSQEKPPVVQIDDERQVACWLYADE